MPFVLSNISSHESTTVPSSVGFSLSWLAFIIAAFFAFIGLMLNSAIPSAISPLSTVARGLDSLGLGRGGTYNGLESLFLDITTVTEGQPSRRLIYDFDQ